MNTGSVQADNGAGLTLGIIGLVNKGQPRKPDDWGVLRAWAWGASRALDYFETDKAVDARQVALEGHSRWGKATIVAMAYDPRFWTAYVSSSGEGGAKMNRRNWGEIVENIASTAEYHWMAGNFLKYAGPLTLGRSAGRLARIDGHVRAAARLPQRRKGGYDAGTGGDRWVDAKGTFLAGGQPARFTGCSGRKPMGATRVSAHRDPGGRRWRCRIPAAQRRSHRCT